MAKKKYNKHNMEVVDCMWCGNEAYSGTNMCHLCWELNHRIEANPELARKMLGEIK